jgi:hypothetical protein
MYMQLSNNQQLREGQLEHTEHTHYDINTCLLA